VFKHNLLFFQDLVTQYEQIVSEHQLHYKTVMEMQEWLDATNNTVILWSDLNAGRVCVEANLKKLENLEQKLSNEKYRIDKIHSLGEKVLPSTSDEGKANIREQIDTLQQNWEILASGIK
jgi:hypothetical protein